MSGHTDRAIAWTIRARDKEPEDIGLRYLLAFACNATGQSETARRYSSRQILKFMRDIAERARIQAPDAVN